MEICRNTYLLHLYFMRVFHKFSTWMEWKNEHQGDLGTYYDNIPITSLPISIIQLFNISVIKVEMKELICL